MASKPLRFHPQAEQEYLTALAWYRERSPIAATNFEGAFGQAIARIKESLADLLHEFPAMSHRKDYDL